MTVLEIKKLSKNFGEKKAVNQVSFNLQSAEILAILGESGSGKTTLLHLIAALQEPDSGTLMLDNQRIIPPSEKLIAGHSAIKLVKQDYGLFPNMSVRENIAYELRFYEEKYRNQRIDKLLKISGLTKIQNSLPRQISGGEQQRTVIIKALAEQPKLLLLDEPFSHLDTRNKRILKQEILKIIKEEAVACVFVTHDATDAYGIADRLAIMQKGKFLQIDKPQKVYNQPISQYIAEITGELAVSDFGFLKDFKPNDSKFQNFIFQNIEKFRFLRPEKISISESADFQAIINEIKFCGAYFELIVEIEKVLLKIISFQKFEINQTIGLNFDLE